MAATDNETGRLFLAHSIKKLEPLYGFTRSVPLREANEALNSFEAALMLAKEHALVLPAAVAVKEG